MTRLFDFAFATSTPESVAIFWHGAINAAPFVLYFGVRGVVYWRDRRRKDRP